MDEKRAERIAAISAHCPTLYRKGYLKVTKGRAPPRRAIRIMCLHCCGWERAESSQCTAYGCPLWVYNPWRAEAEADVAPSGASSLNGEANSASQERPSDLGGGDGPGF